MAPFGETVLAWRLTRGMTQATLASAAHIPRPNLSAIERGDREVTLKTLRALALALDVRPGVLVDGVMPEADVRPMTRETMERVATATARGSRLTNTRETVLSRRLGAALSARMTSGVTRTRKRLGPRENDRAYFLLRTVEEPQTLASLFTRVTEKLDRS
ncbi:MAG TPA: helix-turn-helix transcriptional regulator [Polyangia bacterium]|nr:helix-turn-helix transcriptional regulator [Polyangia bacterium]